MGECVSTLGCLNFRTVCEAKDPAGIELHCVWKKARQRATQANPLRTAPGFGDFYTRRKRHSTVGFIWRILCLLYFTELMWPHNVTLLSQKISIKWLWPVKRTLKVIKRRLKVFPWSCDGVLLKWNKKIAKPPEPIFLNVYRAQDSILRNVFRQPMKPGRPVW